MNSPAGSQPAKTPHPVLASHEPNGPLARTYLESAAFRRLSDRLFDRLIVQERRVGPSELRFL